MIDRIDAHILVEDCRIEEYMNTRYICDICNKEIEHISEASEYKVKRLAHLANESWWVPLMVHNTCWRELCKSIIEKGGL